MPLTIFTQTYMAKTDTIIQERGVLYQTIRWMARLYVHGQINNYYVPEKDMPENAVIQ